MDTAIKSLELRGHTIELLGEERRKETCALIEGERISFRILEQVRRVPHEPTRRELADSARWGSHWRQEYNYVPTGKLSFEVEGWLVSKSLKRRWSDSARRPLEEQVGEFVVGIEAIGRIERQRTEEREERLRQEATIQARAAEAEALRLREQRRLSRLIDLADNWNTASRVRAFLDELEQRGASTNGIGDLVEWGRLAADQLDPLKDPKAITEAFAESDGHPG